MSDINMRSIRLIHIEHCRGEGTTKNPYRTVQSYWTLKGEKLFELDPVDKDGNVVMMSERKP